MRKLPAKLLGLFALGLVSLMSTLTFAQGLLGQDPQYNPDVPGSTALAGDTLLQRVKTVINRALGLLALIALIILIFGGFQMITAAGDDAKYKKGFKILEQAAIGLIFIGAAWLIISIIFFVIGML